MTMLTHTRGPFKPAPYSSERRDTVAGSAARAHLTMIKRFCTCALTILAAGGAIAAIVALKAAIFFLGLSLLLMLAESVSIVVICAPPKELPLADASRQKISF